MTDQCVAVKYGGLRQASAKRAQQSLVLLKVRNALRCVAASSLRVDKPYRDPEKKTALADTLILPFPQWTQHTANKKVYFTPSHPGPPIRPDVPQQGPGPHHRW